jgi:hypothetical protein
MAGGGERNCLRRSGGINDKKMKEQNSPEATKS